MSIGYSIQIAKNRLPYALVFSKIGFACDLFPGTELFIIALALYSQVATVFIQ